MVLIPCNAKLYYILDSHAAKSLAYLSQALLIAPGTGTYEYGLLIYPCRACTIKDTAAVYGPYNRNAYGAYSLCYILYFLRSYFYAGSGYYYSLRRSENQIVAEHGVRAFLVGLFYIIDIYTVFPVYVYQIIVLPPGFVAVDVISYISLFQIFDVIYLPAWPMYYYSPEFSYF